MKFFGFTAIVLFLICPINTFAQGSIFGQVTNSDLSTPANGEISFFGYLDDTDDEIRIETAVGAGYDAGNWYDDFQNYLTESPGNPYDYHFYNKANGEGTVLAGTIPNNSFQQENISLTNFDDPSAPLGFVGAVNRDTIQIRIGWEMISGLTYHVYRRTAASEGSFFRIDDSSGSNPGVADSFFVDTEVDGFSDYQYLIIAENQTATMGPHSEIITVSSVAETFLCGDANGDESINIGDAVYLINYVFRSGAFPDPLCLGDANGDDAVNIGDPVYVINYVFKSGPAPIEPCCP